MLSMDEKIFEARVRLLLRQWPVIWGGNLTVQTICGAILWPYFSHLSIVLWCGGNYVLFALRLMMRRPFESCVRVGPAAVRRWARIYAWSALLGGLIWGSGAWLFFEPSQPQLTVFLLIVLIGISVAGLPALSSYSPAYMAFASALIIPMSARLWMLDWIYSGWLSLLAIIFLGVNLFYSRNLDRTIASSITADLQNRLLLDEVTGARDSAQQANQAKSRFLASVSHDLRQPLHAMGLFMESLRGHLHEPQQKSLFENISIARTALEDMFEALLEVSRLETGAVIPVFTHFHLRPVIDDLVAGFSEKADRKGLILEVVFDDTVVHSDSVLLSGILRNLLSNAIKYTDSGWVRVECHETDGMIELSVRDSGRGIPPEDHQLIFSEYYQLDNPERDRTKGLGLGLAVVKRTADLLKHPLQFASAPGEGSVFSLKIPSGEATRVALIRESIPQRNLTGLHILVIDDDVAVRAGTFALLSNWSCDVTVSESAAAALVSLAEKERPPDLLICDFRLRGGHTGIEAIAAVRAEIDPELPALLVTGDTDPVLRSRIAQQGYYILSKPIKPAQLQHVMAELLA